MSENVHEHPIKRCLRNCDFRDASFERACAIEINMASQNGISAQTKPTTQSEHPDQRLAFTLSVWNTVWGKKQTPLVISTYLNHLDQFSASSEAIVIDLWCLCLFGFSLPDLSLCFIACIAWIAIPGMWNVWSSRTWANQGSKRGPWVASLRLSRRMIFTIYVGKSTRGQNSKGHTRTIFVHSHFSFVVFPFFTCSDFFNELFKTAKKLGTTKLNIAARRWMPAVPLCGLATTVALDLASCVAFQNASWPYKCQHCSQKPPWSLKNGGSFNSHQLDKIISSNRPPDFTSLLIRSLRWPWKCTSNLVLWWRQVVYTLWILYLLH